MIPRTAQQYLDTFINHEIHLGQVRPAQFKLQRVQQLLRKLGDPHKGLKAVHVAGTKGKGSVCALVSSILQKAGYKTGLYTSPHIDHYRERIRILKPEQSSLQEVSRARLRIYGEDIFPDCMSEEELRAVIEEIKPAVEEVRSQKELGLLSFFEVYTALALYYFRKQNVEWVVLETGLGGRLDATNVVDSLVAVITPVSLEHTRILGDTIAQIAGEKAGIIKKKGQKVVIAAQTPEAYAVLLKRCHEWGIDPILVEKYAECTTAAQNMEGQVFDLSTPRAVYRQIRLPLLGKHQRENAATSICVAECLREAGCRITDEALHQGCADVFWPGRFEVVRRKPLIILDGAHNAASARALSETVKEVFGARKIILVLGISEDKDKKSICEELRKIARKTIFAKADHPRAGDLPGAVDVKTAVRLAQKEAKKEDMILVAGSIFVASEARRYLLNEKEGQSPKALSPI